MMRAILLLFVCMAKEVLPSQKIGTHPLYTAHCAPTSGQRYKTIGEYVRVSALEDAWKLRQQQKAITNHHRQGDSVVFLLKSVSKPRTQYQVRVKNLGNEGEAIYCGIFVNKDSKKDVDFHI